MALLSPGVHRALDFVTVAVFALAPTVFGLVGWPAWISYALAAVHLLMTVLTRFPGVAGPIPPKLHGMVELAVGVVLIVLPFVAGWTGAARWFFFAMGLVILAVRFLSSYAESGQPA